MGCPLPDTFSILLMCFSFTFIFYAHNINNSLCAYSHTNNKLFVKHCSVTLYFQNITAPLLKMSLFLQNDDFILSFSKYFSFTLEICLIRYFLINLTLIFDSFLHFKTCVLQLVKTNTSLTTSAVQKMIFMCN